MRRIISLILVWMLLLSSVASAHLSIERQNYPNTLSGEHFNIYFATTGPSATTRKYAEQLLKLAEEAYDGLVTLGGLRPPRVLPVPIVIESAEASKGGEVNSTDFGLDLYISINPHASSNLPLDDVVAHELFHVLQASYHKGSGRPEWAIEGTAPVAVAYAFDRKSGRLEKAMTGHLSAYWIGHDQSLKQTKYMPSLFFYWLAEKYGGLPYLDRLLTWSEDVEWERAVQLAALQGGAPADTTFDRLWRFFVFDMINGQMPDGYETDRWYDPSQLQWTGGPVDLTRGQKRTGVSAFGRLFAYYQPLVLAPYSFQLVEILQVRSGAFALTIAGDQGSVEAYVIEPGPRVAEALRDPEKRPQHNRRLPLPTDPLTVGAPVKIGSAVRLEATGSGRLLLLLMRLGNWGHGQYSLHLGAASAATPPRMVPLTEITHPADSAGSPPKLTAKEHARLAEGTFLSMTSPLEVKELPQVATTTIQLTVGSPTALTDDKEVTLETPVTRDSAGRVWFSAKEIAPLLGATVEKNRITLGSKWVEITPGAREVRTSTGRIPLTEAPREQGDKLLTTSDLFSVLGCRVVWSGDEYTFTYPSPDGL